MARANRHYSLNRVWHLTHRCHQRQFLLKFEKDRRRWMAWLYEARQRFELRVLNYMVTSNHVHLLVLDSGEDVIPKSLQLIAGRTGQEYNQRKGRKGAFWEDRYHATAIDTDEHLIRCLVYMDLNMVRAGVVKHPSEWTTSGYHEIQNPPKRYSRIDVEALMDLCGMKDHGQFKREHRQWVEEALKIQKGQRESAWTESIAVGGGEFVEGIKAQLMSKASGRKIIRSSDGFELRESITPYRALLEGEKGLLSPKNGHFLDD